MQRCIPRETLSRYMDGETSPASAECVRRHVDACPLCVRALEELRSVDAAIRREMAPQAAPDLAGRVAGDLEARGAFLGARIAAGKRRLFGDRAPIGRIAGVMAAAASIVILSFVGLDSLNRRAWERRTEPVLADARRVLVRLVLVDPEEHQEALGRARALARELALAERLAAVRADADVGRAADLGDLARAFAGLAGEDDLGPDLVALLESGDLLHRTDRLRDSLALAR